MVKRNRVLLGAAACFLAAGGALVGYEIQYLNRAHGTFDNYYEFRGCVRLIDRSEFYGDCQTAEGKVIRIVKYHDAWYLDGDLPWACVGSICAGI